MYGWQKLVLGLVFALGVVLALGETDGGTAIGWVAAGAFTLWFAALATRRSMLSAAWGFARGTALGGVVVAKWIFTKHKPSARFMGWFEKWRLFNSRHKGFLVDGHRKRLSENLSFQSLIAVGGMGMGKSSIFVMPNLFTLDDCSLVVTDTSGEIYAQTSGYLATKGFDIKVFSLMEPGVGETYNPLEGAMGFTEISQAANLIVRSALDSGEDQFWTAGAEKIIRIFIQCLRNRGEPEYCNLANVLHLLNSYDAHIAGAASRIDRFVVESTLDDPATYADYKGFTAGNEKTVLSFLSTATTALSAVGNPDIARLTVRSSFSFSDLRKRKTALYVMARQQDMRFYSFILNLFYTELFNTMLGCLDREHLPVYALLDEFGHLTIPNFDIVATTARKYRVGIWVFLQSISQLRSRYGDKGAETIQEGFGTHIYLPGVGLDTAKALERRLGKIRVPLEQDGKTVYREETLLNESEIIQMRGNEALLIHANRRPIKLSTSPYYAQRTMVRKSQIHEFLKSTGENLPVQRVSL